MVLKKKNNIWLYELMRLRLESTPKDLDGSILRKDVKTFLIYFRLNHGDFDDIIEDLIAKGYLIRINKQKVRLN